MRKIVLGFFLCMIAACGNKETEMPSDVIPQDKMMHVLMDIHLAEAGLRTENTFRADSLTQMTVNYYQFIFDKHQVTKEEFRRSFRFYTDNPEMMEKIYQKMIEEMSKKEAEINK